MTKPNPKYVHLLGLLVLIYLVVFLKLDSFHMRWWDESMFAVNTYEMMHNGNYFSLYFDGAPDLFNTKPPLTNWMQIISVKMIGYNELAIRLPSAIASALTVIMLFNFVSKYYNRTLAWLSALILLTSYGFIHFHTARTGDADALLTFFLIAANISFLKYTIDANKKHIIIFFLFITLAFATKMYAALLFVPAYLIILIRYKKLKEFVLNKFFLAGMAIFFLSGFLLIYLRELDTPGYVQQILFKDAGRMFKVVEEHEGSPFFYLENFFKTRFSIWALMLVIGSVLVFFSERRSERNLLIDLIILTITYLLIISCSITKLEWYDMPLYPIIAILSAYPVFLLLKLPDRENESNPKKQFIIITILFLYPFCMMFNKSQGNIIKSGEKVMEANERFLFKKNKEKKDLNGIKVYHSGYSGSLLFYKYKLSEVNQKIEINTSGVFNANDKVLVSNDSLIGQLQKKYNYSVIDRFDKAQLIVIKSGI
jgi:4-amino-4-deoxy-L-arabinose transferase-like glycosyltransferase